MIKTVMSRWHRIIVIAVVVLVHGMVVWIILDCCPGIVLLYTAVELS